jgi:transposase
VLFVGDDWAEDHHDVELVDETGRRLARAQLPEGLEGVSRLHALIAADLSEEWADLKPEEAARRVVVGIETDRGPWVQALLAAGYVVFAINPMQVARYREWHSTSGAKGDAGDAHVLAEIVRLDREHHRPVAGDSPDAEAVKLLARTHQSLIWDRTRQVLRLRSALREFFPAALEAFDDLTATDTLELLGRAPDPDRAARLSRAHLGRRRIVLARYARNRRLADALHQWAFCSLRGSPGARAYYQALRSRGIGHQARPPPAQQPPRRHPSRLPEDRHCLQRTHRLELPHPDRRLTAQNMGCLPHCARDHAAEQTVTCRASAWTGWHAPSFVGAWRCRSAVARETASAPCKAALFCHSLP